MTAITLDIIKLAISNFINPRKKLELSTASSYTNYLEYHNGNHDKYLKNYNFETSLIPKDNGDFTLNGFCHVCNKSVPFIVDFLYSYEINGKLTPNWRERLLCPQCNLNNRLRAALHIFDDILKPKPDSNIYITEQTTPLYNHLKLQYPNLVGSEYLGDSVQMGYSNEAGIRNEDLTQLSFQEDELDFILTFDVLEHIPDYQKALTECFRCLKPNGFMLFSIPFALMDEKNIVRARLNKEGGIDHLLPPEYHGDPINSDGLLCFYHFGWQLLEEMNAIGFKDTKALFYWSSHFGYLGGNQFMFMARKP